MFRARRLAQYSKYHLITPDENLESDLRKIEGLSQRKKIKAKESCVFGFDKCPVRATLGKIEIEKLARFCATCGRNKQSMEGRKETDEEL
jgi:ferredoxin-thioredoxin reductase catalytic subunit